MPDDAGDAAPAEVMDRQPTLVGELVRVRPLRRDDHDALFAVASDPLLWAQHPSKDRAEPEGFRRWFAAALDSGGALTVHDRTTGEVIGSSRYDHLDPGLDRVEIGWTFLARSRWGGAHNRDLKRLMVDHALASVGTVVFRVHEHNLRSQRAVAKLGARRVGTEVDRHGRGTNVVFHLTDPARRDPTARH